VVAYHAELVAELVGDVANVTVVVGFPYGVQNTRAKQAEVEALSAHADELDMVMNRTAFANNDHECVVEDISAVKAAVGEKTLKCIIESPALSGDEVRTAAELVAEGGTYPYKVVKAALQTGLSSQFTLSASSSPHPTAPFSTSCLRWVT
jgi:deoxyribose-phosphate aldolase